MPTTSSMTVDQAHAFFKAAHAGQVDKQGRDYYTHHLVPIANEVAHLGEAATIAALGHDYIEDVHEGNIDTGVAALRAEGTPEPSIAAIVSVTRLPGETYPDLIGRSCADPLGVHIKLADNGHNIGSNPGLAVIDMAKATSMLTKRYLPARDRLIEARTLHTLGLYPLTDAPRKTEHRVQRATTDTAGGKVWQDVFALPANTSDDDIAEAVADQALVPGRRLVKVMSYEVIEPL